MKQKTEYVDQKVTRLIKLEEDLHSIISVAMRVQCNAKVIGSISLANVLLITSAEYMSLKN
jgi:selenophosphate synthetase-related protein